MDSRYIAAAIPLFFLMIFAELLLARRRRRTLLLLHDSIANLSCGVGQQIVSIFYKGIALFAYVWIFERMRIATISERSIVAWIALMLALDLCYYWFHRASHRVNLFWAAHVVHHQSEEYNLTVALRQSWLGGLLAWIFYLPLAFVGFSPRMYLTMTTLNTLYQFWIHTRLVGRMGVLESFLNTPSHHRVHHGIDPKYIDKNYAGMFIIWDRIFGTFEPESTEPVYGVVKPLESFNPAWANVEYFAVMGRMMRSTHRLRDKLVVPFMPPEWRPSDLGGVVTIPEVSRDAQSKYEIDATRSIDAYVIVHFAIAVFATSGFLLVQEKLPQMQLASIGALVVVALIAWGGLVESKWWAKPLEIVRLAGIVLVTNWIMHGSRPFLPALGFSIVLVVTSTMWVSRFRRPGRTNASANPRKKAL